MFKPFIAGVLHGQSSEPWMGFPVAGLPWHVREGQSQDGWTCVKRSHTRCVLRGAWTPSGASGPVTVYAKRYRLRNWRKSLFALVYSPKAPREFAVLSAMQRRGIPAPRPILWAVERRGFLPDASYLLTETLGEDGQPLRHFFAAQSAAERQRLIAAAGQFLRAAHDQGFYHDDCSAEHFYLDVPAWRALPPDTDPVPVFDLFAFLDVDNARMGKTPVGESRRLKNLVQLWRSFGKREDILTREMKDACWVAYWGQLSKEDAGRCRARLNRIARRKLDRHIF